MRPPDGTSLYDVSDPLHPKFLLKMDIPLGWHSHKVRAQDGIMIVNYEKFRDGAPEFGGGLGIFDVSTPSKPKLISKWQVSTNGGGGVSVPDCFRDQAAATATPNTARIIIKGKARFIS